MSETPVTIADYGLGNIFSLERALRHLGVSVEFARDAESVRRAKKLILPGVGAFGDGIRRLDERGMTDAVKAYAAENKPLLGICLGMQLLFSESEEFGRHEGLGLVPGKVKKFAGRSFERGEFKVPNIGWRALEFDGTQKKPLLAGVRPQDSVYFVHSFCAAPDDRAHLAASSEYGGSEYSAVIQKGNIHGCQFHPEKSGPVGLAILRSFCELNGRGA